MYSSFAPSTYYVYVTDEQGSPIAVQHLSGRVLSNLKKIYDTELKKLKDASGGKIKVADMPVEMRRQAGTIVLDWLAANTPPENLAKHQGLELHQVDIVYGQTGIEKFEQQVGERSLP